MPVPTYLNFDLLIEPVATGYRAHVLASPAGEGKSDFDLPFSTDEVRSVAPWPARLARHLRPAADTAASRALTPQQFGERLFDALFRERVGECLTLSWQAANAAQAGLRIRLRLDDGAPELADLPWEYLYSPAWQRFLALSYQTPLVRYINQSGAGAPLAVTGSLRLLAVVAAPLAVSELEGQREWQLLQAATTPLVQSGRLHIEALVPPTLVALQDRLRRGDIHLLHFIGHGFFDATPPRGGLIFENADHTAHDVDAATLAMLLHDHAPRLIFLNACDGARSGVDDYFAGVAQQLVQQRIPAVIAMQYPISDAAAIVLAHTFYKALTDGYPADAALGEARKAVAAQGNLYEWATPVLFSRSSDNQLFSAPIETPAPSLPNQTHSAAAINTGGGTLTQGDVNAGADFVGRDKITHNTTIVVQSAAEANTLLHPQPAPPDLRQAVIERQEIEPETVLIPAGDFSMGAADAPPAWRRHRWHLASYRIGKVPVTNAEYQHFVAAYPEYRPQGSGWRYSTPPPAKLDHPVTGISWHAAVAYCDWLSQQTQRIYRLPSEAEWEKAARGDQDGRAYPWGETLSANFCNLQSGATTPVYHYDQGISPFGCYDMVGNVREWTNTIWGDNPARPQFSYPYRADKREEKAPRGSVYRIYRGGAFDDPPKQLGCSARGFYSPDAKLTNAGLRVVLQIES